jgi:hypothetical protein
MNNPDLTGAEPGSQNRLVTPMGQYPSYGYQPQYGAYSWPPAPQYGAYPGPAVPQPQYGAWQPPPDYRALVIAALVGGVLFSLLIGMPMALIAQRNSRRVQSTWESGDPDGAVRASRSARSWAIASMVFDVLGLLLVIVLLSRSGQPTS